MRKYALLRVGFLSFLLSAGAVFGRDFRLEKHFPLAPGGAFTLNSGVGSVTVRGGNANEAVVIVTSEREDFEQIYKVSFDAQAARLGVSIERRSPGFFSWFSGFHGRTKIEVSLPRQVNAGVRVSGGGLQISNLQGTVQAASSGGGVRIAEIEGNVTLSSSGGSVHAEQVHGTLHADSSGGGVEVKGINGSAHLESSGGSIVAEAVAGDLQASTSGGGVQISEAHGKVDAESSGGSVAVGFAAGNAKGGSLDSSGGGVSVKVDPSVHLDIDASSSGGHVSSDLPVTVQGKISRGSLHGTLNGGGAVLRLRSSGGGVSLAPR